MLTLSISLEGAIEAIDTFDGVSSRMSNLEAFYERVGKYELKRAQERIKEGGNPPWQPTKYPANGHAMLQKTGALYASLDQGSVQVTPQAGTFGSDLPYAPYVQFGSSHKRLRGGDLPARPYLYYDAQDEEWIKDTLASYIVNGEL